MSSTHTSPDPSHTENRSAYPQTPRKMASTGGGRAWSEEEENFLIERRQHKMPYKHIAARLNKTELACRLHYHQLSFGTKRRQARRRTSSVSSAISTGSNPNSAAGSVHGVNGLTQQRPLPQLSPPDSPEHRGSKSRSQSPSQPSHLFQSHYALNQSPPPNGNQASILPKPICTSSTHQPIPSALNSSNALRLITTDIERYEERNRIDKARLGRIYEAHRGQFWAAVARDYGEQVAPHVLEDAWWRSVAGGANPMSSGPLTSHFPPTPPSRSPHQTEKPALAPLAANTIAQIPPTSAFRAVNAPSPPQMSSRMLPSLHGRNSSFAISSLLTEDKEIRTSQAPQLASVAAH